MTIADSTLGICTWCSVGPEGGDCDAPSTGTMTYGACYEWISGVDTSCSTTNGKITCTVLHTAPGGNQSVGVMTFTPS